MARVFNEVVGIDLSQTFVDMANQVKADGSVGYRLKVEGDITTEVVAKIDLAIDASRCTFLQVRVGPWLGRLCGGDLQHGFSAATFAALCWVTCPLLQHLCTRHFGKVTHVC
jgi:hypothetical protein